MPALTSYLTITNGTATPRYLIRDEADRTAILTHGNYGETFKNLDKESTLEAMEAFHAARKSMQEFLERVPENPLAVPADSPLPLKRAVGLLNSFTHHAASVLKSDDDDSVKALVTAALSGQCELYKACLAPGLMLQQLIACSNTDSVVDMARTALNEQTDLTDEDRTDLETLIGKYDEGLTELVGYTDGAATTMMSVAENLVDTVIKDPFNGDKLMQFSRLFEINGKGWGSGRNRGLKSLVWQDGGVEVLREKAREDDEAMWGEQMDTLPAEVVGSVKEHTDKLMVVLKDSLSA